MAIHRNLAAKNRIQKQKLNADIQKQPVLVETKIKKKKITTANVNKNKDVSEFSRKLLHSTIGIVTHLV
jgi:hypothetical protein